MIATGATGNDIRTRAAAEVIIIGATINGVITQAATDVVRTEPSDKNVVTVIADYGIIAITTDNAVRLGCSGNVIFSAEKRKFSG